MLISKSFLSISLVSFAKCTILFVYLIQVCFVRVAIIFASMLHLILLFLNIFGKSFVI